MTNFLIRRSMVLALALAIPVVFLSGFSGNNQWTLNNSMKAGSAPGCDTVPAKSKKALIEKDYQLSIHTEAVESAIREVEKSMNRLKSELRNIDLDEPVERVYKKIDDVNWRLMNDASQRALMQAQMQLNVAKLKIRVFNDDNVRLDDIRKDLILSKFAMENSKRNMQLAMNISKDKGFKKINMNLMQLNKGWLRIKEFKDDLEKDGLIKKGEPYTIEIKDGFMYIDGKKQSKKVNRRYKEKYPSYFEEGNNFKLQNDGKEPPFKEGELI